MSRRRYLVNEAFYSLQGEGVRAGTPNAFLRFAKCNLSCNQAEHGFDCDTDFATGEWCDADEIVDRLRAVADRECDWVVLTGGEPTLQVDLPLIQLLRCVGWHLAIETNGTRPLPFGLDWITVSPKTADLAVTEADEVKYVLAAGAELPRTTIKADHYLISPAFTWVGCDHDGDCAPPACPGPTALEPETLEWCIRLCLENPPWRLSAQQHKWWGVR